MTNAPYVTLATLKLSVGIPVSDVRDDTLLNTALAGATWAIDDFCHREGTGFNLDAVASPRVYEARDPQWLPVDDIGDLTGFAVATGQVGSFTNAIPTTDFETRPLNALVKGRPIEALRHYWAFFPTWPSLRVQVTARWGWPAIPQPVSEACLIYAARLYRRKDSPDGTAGVSDFGPVRISPADPDVVRLLGDYVSDGGGFA